MDQHHAAWLERHADRDGAWLKANTVPEIKLLVDKADAIIAYMRKAGNYDLDTVREYKMRQCEAVVKGGRLLEDMAPKKPGPAKDSDSGVAIYFETLERASIKEKTAELSATFLVCRALKSPVSAGSDLGSPPLGAF